MYIVVFFIIYIPNRISYSKYKRTGHFITYCGNKDFSWYEFLFFSKLSKFVWGVNFSGYFIGSIVTMALDYQNHSGSKFKNKIH